MVPTSLRGEAGLGPLPFPKFSSFGEPWPGNFRALGVGEACWSLAAGLLNLPQTSDEGLSMLRSQEPATEAKKEILYSPPTHFISLSEWSSPRIRELLRLATAMKEAPGDYRHILDGRMLLMMFQKPSFRTRVSFESAMASLGGHSIAVDSAGTPWGSGRETPADMVRTVSSYVDVLMTRLFSHAELLNLAAYATIPVINGQTDLEHPCQALGDLLTLQDRFGSLEGLRLAYVGDAQTNIAHSLLDACSKMGIHLSIGCPHGKDYEPDRAVLARARDFAKGSGARLDVVHDPRVAVSNADAVYTDTWMSYQISPAQRAERSQVLTPFR